MKDEDWHVRRAAVEALGQIASLLSDTARAQLIETLLAAMKDEDWHVREGAVRALGEHRAAAFEGKTRPTHQAYCIAAMQDEDSHVRLGAAHSLRDQSGRYSSDAERASKLIEPLHHSNEG